MFRDPQLIITFQLALIGIVLIGGLFLIWKAVTRIEEKVDMLFTGNLKPEQPFSFELDDDVRGDREYNNDIMMQQLFGNLEEDKQEEDIQEEDKQEEDIKEIKGDDESIEDIQEIREDDESIEEIKEPNSVEEIEEIDEINVEDNSTLVLSRNKLRQMRLEQVQRLCIDRNIDSDGTKNQLIEKLLQ